MSLIKMDAIPGLLIQRNDPMKSLGYSADPQDPNLTVCYTNAEPGEQVRSAAVTCWPGNLNPGGTKRERISCGVD